MLRTPDSFVSLLTVPDHASPQSLVFSGDALLVQDADLALPSATWIGRTAAPYLPVGLLDGQYYQCSWVDAHYEAPPGMAFRKLRSLFGKVDDTLVAIAGRGYQIAEWARTHRFCGACGTPTTHVPGERCARCPACGHSAYPRISPAMMVLIRKGDRLLLTATGAGATTLGATILGATVFEATDLGATVLGASVLEASVFGAAATGGTAATLGAGAGAGAGTGAEAVAGAMVAGASTGLAAAALGSTTGGSAWMVTAGLPVSTADKALTGARETGLAGLDMGVVIRSVAGGAQEPRRPTFGRRSAWELPFECGERSPLAAVSVGLHLPLVTLVAAFCTATPNSVIWAWNEAIWAFMNSP
jgi:hypothetical protein